MGEIEHGGASWTIGALVTIGQLENDKKIEKVFPGLHEAAMEIASPQIRNVATVGGNLAQHSRCWYFRHRDTVCLKKWRRPLLCARRGEPLSQIVHRQYMHQPGGFQPGDGVCGA